MIVVEGAGNLSGTITDPAFNRPIQGAQVRAIGNYQLLRITDQDGAFEFADIPAFTYIFQITADDFLPLTTGEIVIQDGDDVELELELMHARLTPDPARIELAMQPNDTLTFPLNIANTGNGLLTWSATRVFPENVRFDPWEYRWGLLAGEVVEDNRLIAVEFVGDHFYVAGGNNGADENLVYVLDREGNPVRQFPQFAESMYGMRDLAWDGSLLWGVDGGQVYGFALDGELDRQFDDPMNPGRFIAYDPVRDVLWICNVSTSIAAVDRDGNPAGEIDRPEGGLHVYGMSWYPEDPDGYNLYIFNNEQEITRQVHKVDVETGEVMHVADLQGAEGRFGGSTITGVWDPYSWVIVGLMQSNPDALGIWQMGMRTNWVTIAGEAAGAIDPGDDIDMDVRFNTLGLPPEEEFTADLVFAHDGVNGVSVVSVSLFVTGEGGVSQRMLNLDLGWNLVSVNVAPVAESFAAAVLPLVEAGELILAKDGRGDFYIPGMIDDVEHWVAAEGYWLKVARPTALRIEGEVIPWNTPIELLDGWNVVSYYPRQDVDARVALSGLGESLQFARDGAGRFYLPSWDFSDIGLMREGCGYLLRMNGDGELTYSLEDEVDGYRSRYGASDLAWLSGVQRTGVSYSLLLCGGEAGERVEAYAPGGVLAGRGVFGDDGRCGLALWGDDVGTPVVEGFAAGDAPVIVRAGDGVAVEYAWLEGGSGGWVADGWGVAEVVGGALPEEFGICSAYPNPFNGRLRLEYSLGLAGDVRLSVYDVSGRLVDELAHGARESGRHVVSWDASGMSSGVYIVRLWSAGDVQTVKALLVR